MCDGFRMLRPLAPADWKEDDFVLALAKLADTGDLDASHRRISSEQMARIMEAAPLDAPGRPRFGSVGFLGTTFPDFNLTNATFRGNAWFNGATFEGYVLFGSVHFAGRADFSGVRFNARAIFAGSTFSEGGDYSDATFENRADFRGTRFVHVGSFQRTTFCHTLDLAGASFVRDPATDADDNAGGSVYFDGAAFNEQMELGPIVVGNVLRLDRADVARRLTVRATASTISLCGATFRDGIELFVDRAEVVADDADFRGASLITYGSAASASGWSDEEPSGATALAGLDTDAPRVISLRRAKIGELSLSTVDLRSCRFAGSHGLAGLRLERTSFAGTPDGTGLTGWLRRRRWTRREVLAEEHEWRSRHHPGGGWYAPQGDAPPVAAGDIAVLYRELRRSREETRDEPGAADFYYGEMEMRRHAARDRRAKAARRATRAEEVILCAYWLVSGYGLRASRAFASLAVVIALFAALFSHGGLSDPGEPVVVLRATPANGVEFRQGLALPAPSFADALVFSAATATAIFGAPDRPLTRVGQWERIVLRIIGPVLIGLGLLGIRSRVKR